MMMWKLADPTESARWVNEDLAVEIGREDPGLLVSPAFVNLTPHPLRLEQVDGTFLELAPDGPAPRRQPLREPLGSLEGLPDPKDGVILIVSALVAEACPDRTDLASPGEAIRGTDRVVIGARGLAAGPGLARVLGEED